MHNLQHGHDSRNLELYQHVKQNRLTVIVKRKKRYKKCSKYKVQASLREA